MVVEFTGIPDVQGEYHLSSEDDQNRTFNLIVRVADIRRIEVGTPPDKTEYVVGESFDPRGLSLNIIYSDDSQRTVTDTSAMEFDTDVLNIPGVASIQIAYMGWDTSLNVNVNTVAVDSRMSYAGVPTVKGEYVLNCQDSSDNDVFLHVVVDERTSQSRISYSGTPSVAGRYSLGCEDKFGNEVDLHVTVVDRATEENNCYLIRYDEDGEYILPLPNIQSIEETLTASITEISTIVYGFDDNFAMDLGTTQRYSVTLRRVQPIDVKPIRDDDPEWVPQSYSDIDDWMESVNWSNGAWFKAFEVFIDGWQNLNWGMIDTDGNGTKEKVRSGGFRLRFWPPSESYREYDKIYDDLYPKIDRMGFISGSISPRFSGNNLQYLDVTIPLAVSSMIRSAQAPDGAPIEYRAGEGFSDSFTHMVPTNVFDVVPSPPMEWVTKIPSKFFTKWTSDRGVDYRVGDRVSANNILTAQWKGASYVMAFTSPGNEDYTVTLSKDEYVEGSTLKYNPDTDTLQIWAIGGGGPGALGTIFSQTKKGGGGGSGGFVTKNVHLQGDVAELKIHVGKGGYTQISPGSGPLNPSKIITYNGEDSYVTPVFEYTVEQEGGSKETRKVVSPSRYVSAEGGKTGHFESGGAAGHPNGAAGEDVSWVGSPPNIFNSRNGLGGVVPALKDPVQLKGEFGGDVTLHSECITDGQYNGYGVCGAGGPGLSYGTLLKGGTPGGDGAVILVVFEAKI